MLGFLYCLKVQKLNAFSIKFSKLNFMNKDSIYRALDIFHNHVQKSHLTGRMKEPVGACCSDFKVKMSIGDLSPSGETILE
jgi:hypothetical protein